jgi:hypothetical protein
MFGGSAVLPRVGKESHPVLAPPLRGNSTKLSPMLEYRQAQRLHFENVSNEEGLGSAEAVMATRLANPNSLPSLEHGFEPK